jgi:acyl carrier protein
MMASCRQLASANSESSSRHQCAFNSGNSMNIDEIYIKLTPLFHDVFEDDEIALSPSLTARDVQGWDSLAHIRLMLTVERKFKINFSAAEIANLKNVGELVGLIASKV